MTFLVFKVELLHCTGEMDETKIAYVKFIQDFVYQNYFKLVDFYLVIQK